MNLLNNKEKHLENGLFNVFLLMHFKSSFFYKELANLFSI